ncbi:MAG: hypothetical protein ABI603_04600 [Acidobacteriota bacterium]
MAVVMVSMLVVAERADGSPLSRARMREGYALAYDLQFAACLAMLEEAAEADPLDPGPQRAIAAVTWMEMLFAQGVATFEAFTGEMSKTDVARPEVPPALADRFRRAIAEATRLSTAQLVRLDDADAHYQIGATEALGAIYGATIDGRLLGSFTQGRRAVAAMERARQRDPGRRESALVLGMSEYSVSTMSWPVRTLARLSGLSGNRESALSLLQEAATSGTETESDALMLLMIIDNREARPADAVRRLEYLRRRHPGNRLLTLNHGAAAMAATQPLEAVRVLSEGLANHATSEPPAVLGETALWLAHRGSALARLHRTDEAVLDLRRGLSSDPRDWVRGRIHVQLGDLAVVGGELVRARLEYDAALGFAERGGDRAVVKDAKQKASALARSMRGK